ncbi:hypothetical protein E2C01_086261 [Portunus trituberculatus]|uniref:Uncharacterized protein n=1 Tax=Portunus trituberculatus TaxID=210409 RepID=A0A5B7JCZ0_PORTR|nr:hypothetical protein [Portunus trituberculatus]
MTVASNSQCAESSPAYKYIPVLTRQKRWYSEYSVSSVPLHRRHDAPPAVFLVLWWNDGGSDGKLAPSLCNYVLREDGRGLYVCCEAGPTRTLTSLQSYVGPYLHLWTRVTVACSCGAVVLTMRLVCGVR